MKEYKFKTTINCNGCVIKVGKVLNDPAIGDWNVDTDNPDKILTVSSESLSADDIIGKIEKTGFKAELIEQA